MSQPKLTLRPPPHREFFQGFPGIVGAGTRPPAHVAGTVEVRLGTKGLKAAWLRIELRKLETLPGGESWGELIGRGPIDVWSAQKDEAYKSESEKGWELLQTADFPFQVTIPEGLPPSAKLEKNAGIGYELVTSLCVRSKKGLLKKETTSSIIQNTHPLWLEKHELHSTWPVYWTPEDHEAIQDDMRVKVMRNRTCYGPGDSIDVRVIITSERVSPLKVKSVTFSVRETITFKGGAKKTFGSNKAASQKTETLSNKSKSFGKKVYKGDTHTFDLSCQIPRTHTLMSIQTAKHIEVSYTLRVQVETAKKPIIIDHLPITVSNFTKTASEALMDRIGWVPGLSTSADGATTVPSPYANESSLMSSPGPMGRQQTISRSVSFGGSTSSLGRGGYPGYPGGDLRRRDTVMTQGTAVSGPGMAGRGVPGQVFSWGQYGSAQPFDSGEAPRPAFAGPSSIYEGHELQPEETRALFHSTNRPQSAMVLGTATDPVLMPGTSYHGHSGGVTPIQERSEDGHSPHSHFAQQSSYQQHDIRRHSEYGGSPAASNYEHGQGVRNPAAVAAGDYRYTASPVNGRTPNSELPYRHSATPELNGTRYVRPQPVHQAIVPERVSSPAPQVNSAMTSAEAEKQTLYERARQQAERNQRRADERRALHASIPSTPVANGGRPHSMLNLASSSSATPSAAPVAGLTAEAEKMRLFERARAEAERYQGSYQQGAAFPASDAAALSAAQSALNGNGAAGASGSSAPETVVSGRAAPYPSYMTAEEEKRQLYEKAKAEAEAFQRGEQAGPSTVVELASGHMHTASVGNGNLGSAAPPVALASGSSAPAPAPVTAPAANSAISEKEQLRRYYEARDAVSQHLSQGAAGSSSSATAASQMYAPEVDSAVHHATPHQPADTVPTPPRTTPTSELPLSHGSPFRPAPKQSYLTQAEQQSAEEKERLASHYARKTAKAEAKAQGKPVGNGNGNGVPAGAVGEKAQLAAYYAARDAMQANLGAQPQARAQQSSSTPNVGVGGSASATIPSKAHDGQAVTASSSVVSTKYAGANPSKVQEQWRPKYNSLYDDDDLDLDESGGVRRGVNASTSSGPPPPLPPKIPIGSGFVGGSGHRQTSGQQWG